MLETVVITLSILLAVALVVIGYLVRALTNQQDKFYQFADTSADRWQRSHYDLSEKVLSHSDDFLEFKRITAPEPPEPRVRGAVRPPPAPAETPEWKPVGSFDDEVITPTG